MHVDNCANPKSKVILSSYVGGANTPYPCRAPRQALLCCARSFGFEVKDNSNSRNSPFAIGACAASKRPIVHTIGVSVVSALLAVVVFLIRFRPRGFSSAYGRSQLAAPPFVVADLVPAVAADQSAAEQPDSGADAGAAMAAINTVPKLGEGDSSNKASQAVSRFLCAANYSPGLPCMMPPSAKMVVAVM